MVHIRSEKHQDVVAEIHKENRNPGPGAHNIRRSDKPTNPKVSFTNQKKVEVFETNDNPGPGQYNIKRDCSTNKKASIKRRYQEIGDRFINFGYDTIKVSKSVPKFSFSHKSGIANNGFNITIDGPGPGQYFKEEEKKVEKKMYDKALQQNREASQSKYINGVCSSSLLVGKKKTMFGTSQRFKSMGKVQQSPGPSDYNPNHNNNTFQQSFSISKQELSRFKDDDRSDVGPGNYDNHLYESKNKKGITFCKSLRNEKLYTADNPGPFEYTCQHKTFKNKHRFSKGEKLFFAREIVNRKIPGPSDYDPQISNSAKQYSFGKEMKLLMESNINNSQSCNNQSGNNISTVSQQINPGPGQYNLDKDILPPQKLTIFKKNNEKDQIRVPGPSDYNIMTYNQIKLGIIAKNNRFGSNDQQKEYGPGPGHYEIPSLDQGIQQSFYRSQPEGSKIESVVGPGSYDVSAEIKIPKYLQNENFRDSYQEYKVKKEKKNR